MRGEACESMAAPVAYNVVDPVKLTMPFAVPNDSNATLLLALICQLVWHLSEAMPKSGLNTVVHEICLEHKDNDIN